jgi:DNA invertase Pin-like site-specific DNA recombinase
MDANLPVISVAERRRLGKKALERLINRAQRERDLISQRVRAGAARAKARGVKLGNRTNLGLAQRNGAISNGARADRKAQELADFIEHAPGWEKMTLKERVELLNASGPHNLISEKRNERRSWTISSIRKPLNKAEAELELRRELEDEKIVIAPNLILEASQDGNADGSKLERDLTT